MIRAHLLTVARKSIVTAFFFAVVSFAVVGMTSVVSARIYTNLPEPEIALVNKIPHQPYLILVQKRRLNNRRQRNRFDNRRRKQSRGFTNRQSNSAVSSGRAASLGNVARRVRQRVPGQLLDARLLKDRRGNLTYKLKILGRNGVMRNVTADAYSGAILGIR